MRFQKNSATTMALTEKGRADRLAARKELLERTGIDQIDLISKDLLVSFALQAMARERAESAEVKRLLAVISSKESMLIRSQNNASENATKYAMLCRDMFIPDYSQRPIIRDIVQICRVIKRYFREQKHGAS